MFEVYIWKKLPLMIEILIRSCLNARGGGSYWNVANELYKLPPQQIHIKVKNKQPHKCAKPSG